MEQQTGYKLGKEYIKAVYWSTHLFNLYAEHIMWNDGLDEAQAGIKISGRNLLATLDKQMTESNQLYGRKQRGTEEPIDENERGEWKSWLKTQHSKN